MFHGEGMNGKTVLLNLISVLLGKENVSNESLQRLCNKEYAVASLYGKLVNICPDIPSSALHDIDVFKQLTGNDIFIRGEKKYKDSFTFRNTARLTFSANELPAGKMDYAYYIRLILVKFPNNFEGKEDKNLLDSLTTEQELSGLLNLALKGLKRLQANDKFSNCKSAKDTQKEYTLNSNHVAAFMFECTESSDKDCPATELYLTYVGWCTAHKIQRLTENGFAKKLHNLNYTKYRENVVGSKSSVKTPY